MPPTRRTLRSKNTPVPRRPAPGGAWLRRLRLIGMVHLPALPGAAHARQTMEAIIERATREAGMLSDAGFDAVIVENFGDAPFAADVVVPETVAAMAIVTRAVVKAVGIPVGVNVLRNDALASLAVAAAAGAAFIRVNVLSGTYATDQGLITGRANELLRRRSAVAPNVAIAADVHVKHATPISQPDIARAAEETVERAGADAVIVSGPATGQPADHEQIRLVRQAVGKTPVWTGSGVTQETVESYLGMADAVIVGTCLKRGGRTTAEIDPARLADFKHGAR